jgi:hypothetical protein
VSKPGSDPINFRDIDNVLVALDTEFFCEAPTPQHSGPPPDTSYVPRSPVLLKVREFYEPGSKIYQQSVFMQIFYQMTQVFLLFCLARDDIETSERGPESRGRAGY